MFIYEQKLFEVNYERSFEPETFFILRNTINHFASYGATEFPWRKITIAPRNFQYNLILSLRNLSFREAILVVKVENEFRFD